MTDRETFERECKRRFGRGNPERMRLAHWEWMVRTGEDPYVVRHDLGLEPNVRGCGAGAWDPADPDWCFTRFGMTRTRLSDDRIICIGGEHEDWYDPDFCIYNDVVVLRPAAGQDEVTLDSGEVEIYGYSPDVFPPTDFHSATAALGSIFCNWSARKRAIAGVWRHTNRYDQHRRLFRGQARGTWRFSGLDIRPPRVV